MLIILVKFIEVGTRALFVVLTTYSLVLAEAGQFGLIVTIQGLTSFAFGYERYIDIQRKMVGEPEPIFDRAVARAIVLFAVNGVVLTPVYLVVLATFAQIDFYLLMFCAVIAFSEQLMNLAYQMAMVNRRYRVFLFIATGKNIVILGMMLASLYYKGGINLGGVLSIWAGVSIVAMVLLAISWFTTRLPAADNDGQGLRESLLQQYKASRTHFLLGLMAILTLQFDRLAVGANLPLETVGIYFRHILLLSLVYQIFNIAFFNRIIPIIYLRAKTQGISVLKSIVAREYLMVLVFVAFLGAGGVILHWATGYTLAERYSLNFAYFTGLLLASILRMRADFNALIFNARMREKTLLKIQVTVFCAGAILMIILTRSFGIPGTIGASIAVSALYLGLTHFTLRMLQLRGDNDVKTLS